MKFFLVINTVLFFFVQSVFLPKKQLPQNAVSTISQSENISNPDSHVFTTNASILAINKSVSNTNQSGNGLLLLSGIAIALSGLGLSYAFKKTTLQLTRWAKANQKKTQLFIAGTQIGMMGLALYQGYNLKMMGYNISTNLQYVFPVLAVIGFASIPFFPKKDVLVLPQKVAVKKLGFLTIALASLLNVACIGNHLAAEHPTIGITQSLQSIDHAIINADVNTVDEIDEQTQQKRKVVSAAITFLSVIGFLFLTCTLCAGICVLGLAAGSFGAVLGGLALIVLSILGMVGIVRGNAKKKKKSS
jgi:hypothetical protein